MKNILTLSFAALALIGCKPVPERTGSLPEPVPVQEQEAQPLVTSTPSANIVADPPVPDLAATPRENSDEN